MLNKAVKTETYDGRNRKDDDKRGESKKKLKLNSQPHLSVQQLQKRTA